MDVFICLRKRDFTKLFVLPKQYSMYKLSVLKSIVIENTKNIRQMTVNNHVTKKKTWTPKTSQHPEPSGKKTETHLKNK